MLVVLLVVVCCVRCCLWGYWQVVQWVDVQGCVVGCVDYCDFDFVVVGFCFYVQVVLCRQIVEVGFVVIVYDGLVVIGQVYVVVWGQGQVQWIVQYYGGLVGVLQFEGNVQFGVLVWCYLGVYLVGVYFGWQVEGVDGEVVVLLGQQWGDQQQVVGIGYFDQLVFQVYWDVVDIIGGNYCECIWYFVCGKGMVFYLDQVVGGIGISEVGIVLVRGVECVVVDLVQLVQFGQFVGIIVVIVGLQLLVEFVLVVVFWNWL